MSVNTLNFEQVSTVLTSIVQQATGQTVLTPTDTGSFVSVAQTALRADRDAVMNAISNILARTIFSIRPYEAKMTGLDMDTFQWGGMMRKLSIADTDWEDDAAYAYPIFYDANQNPPDGEGKSVDPWKIKKPNVLQTNFYGQSVYSDHMTITEEQIETAFSSPDQLASFLSLLMTNLSNRLEMSNEAIRRGLVCNAITALYDENDSDRVIHLLSEYNALTGLSLDNITVYEPSNFPAFTKWVYSRVAEVTDLFTANSQMFQTVINGKPILRHTPYQYQRVYLYSPFQRQIQSRVLADTFHDNYLKYADVETIPYWQSIKTKDSVTATPSYVDNTGTLVTPASPVGVDHVFGLIFDRDAMGMTILDRRVLSTRVNESGLYRNIWVHGKQRAVFDNTEKCAVLLLD
ncbi:MAG: hypothetical protein J6R06_08345 [Bacteroidales bacterium]|nr:hypothetical protein [Bacteroidales bacterium]